MTTIGSISYYFVDPRAGFTLTSLADFQRTAFGWSQEDVKKNQALEQFSALTHCYILSLCRQDPNNFWQSYNRLNRDKQLSIEHHLGSQLGDPDASKWQAQGHANLHTDPFAWPVTESLEYVLVSSQLQSFYKQVSNCEGFPSLITLMDEIFVYAQSINELKSEKNKVRLRKETGKLIWEIMSALAPIQDFLKQISECVADQYKFRSDVNEEFCIIHCSEKPFHQGMLCALQKMSQQNLVLLAEKA